MNCSIAEDISGDGSNSKCSSQDADAAQQLQLIVMENESAMEKLPTASLSPSNHVPSFTGNVPYICAPSPESFLFTQTPAGSELCSWVTDNNSSTNELSLSLTEQEHCIKMLESPRSSPSRREHLEARRKNSLRALTLERQLTDSSSDEQTALVIRFPDPEINSSLVSSFSKGILDVTFPTKIAPRYCLVHLRKDVNVERTIADINQVRFGAGFLKAELQTITDEEMLDNIDPCTLYVRNIPYNMNISAIRAQFRSAQRVDVGTLKHDKRARYAFLRFANADLALEAFQQLVKSNLKNRPLNVRFRRLRKMHTTVVSTNNSNTLPHSTSAIDDDATECRVISPPPVECITIKDSSDSSDSDNAGKLGKNKRKRKRSMRDEEIRNLKQRMAEFEQMFKNLQAATENKDNLLLKTEPMTQETKTVVKPRSLSPQTALIAIKTEDEFFGVSSSDRAMTSPYRPTTAAYNDNEIAGSNSYNCFGRLLAGFGRRKSVKTNSSATAHSTTNKLSEEATMEQLYAQLESDTDI